MNRLSDRKKIIFSLTLTALLVILPAFLLYRTFLHRRGFMQDQKIPSIAPYKYQRDFLKWESDYYIPDKIAGHLHRPHAERIYFWPEHPSRKIILKTNNFGFRNNEDTLPEKPVNTVRILFTGDSHIDGVVNNDENAAAILRTRLNSSEAKGKSYEVLNGGVGSYEFANYSGFMKKFSHLKPDTFIVCSYSGNDFMNAITDAENEKKVVISRPDDHYQRLQRAMSSHKRAHAIVSQVLNQVYFFKQFPEMKRTAVELTMNSVIEMHDFCAIRGIDFLFVLLPTKADLEWSSDAELLNGISASLELSAKDLTVNRRLARFLLLELQQKGIKTLDGYRLMSQHRSPFFYWKEDYHLNVNGHELIANAIYDTYFHVESKNRTP
jgi:lysophospholipase L1-like esterase